MHDFFGSEATDASSTAESLLGTDEHVPDAPADTAAYWVPTLYDDASGRTRAAVRVLPRAE